MFIMKIISNTIGTIENINEKKGKTNENYNYYKILVIIMSFCKYILHYKLFIKLFPKLFCATKGLL